MAEKPQHLDLVGTETVSVYESGSRLRLSANMLKRIRWPDDTDQFECVGLFRYSGELLCVPWALQDRFDNHPFSAALAALDTQSDEVIPSLADIPSAAVLTAPDRFCEFTSKWNSSRNQLSMNLGVKVMRGLGWEKEHHARVHATNRGPILILLSEARYLSSLNLDFTGGSLNI
ncbi:MAG: hypothetical protein F6K42_20800 [Leptolyngbya sp. SIO1D8]|nr:hypothetical protein [Leptolyngbya sp. SIO1D8]